MSYTVTVHMVGPNAPLTNGGNSLAGHMWYTTSDGNHSHSWGFDSESKGRVTREDDDLYKSVTHSKTIEITKEQYDRLIDFSTNPPSYGFDLGYNVAGNNCVDFTWAALDTIGMGKDDFNFSPSQQYNLLDNPIS